MDTPSECYRQWQAAQKRLDRIRYSGIPDQTAILIATGQRDRWFAAWLDADSAAAQRSPIHRTAVTASES